MPSKTEIENWIIESGRKLEDIIFHKEVIKTSDRYNELQDKSHGSWSQKTMCLFFKEDTMTKANFYEIEEGLLEDMNKELLGILNLGCPFD